MVIWKDDNNDNVNFFNLFCIRNDLMGVTLKFSESVLIICKLIQNIYFCLSFLYKQEKIFNNHDEHKSVSK